MGTFVLIALGGLFLIAIGLAVAFGAGVAVVNEFFKALCGSDDD